MAPAACSTSTLHNQHWYKKIDGVWKFAGLAPIIRWGEFDFDSVFASGRDTFGDQKKVEEQVAVAAGVSAEVSASIESATDTAKHDELGINDKSSASQQTLDYPNEKLIQTEESLNGNHPVTQEAGQTNQDTLSGGDEGPVTTVTPQANVNHVDLINIARGDGKYMEVQVEQVPLEDGSCMA